jgi:hypothetical protein
MADTIPGRQTINVGVQNQATGADDLYTAFTKVESNFEKLFTNASPYLNVNSGTGIQVTNPTSNTVTITNTGVTKITSGTGITLDNSNGNVTISVSGTLTGVVAGVTNVNIRSNTLSVGGSPIISSGNIGIELPALATSANFNPGTYVSPTVTVDAYGRVVQISNISSAGTVTKIAVSGGEGISIAGSPIIDSGTINVINTGVTRLTAGPGIALSGSNGAVTISGTNPPTSGISRIDFASNTLSIAGSPITSSGTISLEMPANGVFTKVTTANISTGPVYATGNIYGANANLGNLVTANYTTAVLTTGSQPNITSVGSLTSLTVTGNIGAGNVNLGNIAIANFITINNNANVTANLKAGNANIVTTLTAGNITTTNGIFWANGAPYSPPAPNLLMTSIAANAAIATTTGSTFSLDGFSYVGNVLKFDTVTVDTETGYSTSTGKYTPTVAGYYQVTTSFSPYAASLGSGYSALTDGTHYLILLVKNGTIVTGVGQQIGGMGVGVGGLAWAGWTQSSINTIVQMNGSTDYLQVFLVAVINSGSFTTGVTPSNYLQAIWLRP